MKLVLPQMFKWSVFFVLLCVSLSHTFGQGNNQNQDSLLALEKERPTITYFNNLTSNQKAWSSLNPKIDEAHRHIASNRNLLVFQDLGTPFSPLLNLGTLALQQPGFVSGNNSLSAFQYDFGTRKFYNASMPFTSFRYAQGGQQYIQFDGLHTQNIIPSWNVAAGIQSFTNKGYALRQLQVHRAPFITSHFTLPNNRVRVITHLNWVRRSGYVSGGLSRLAEDTLALADAADANGDTLKLLPSDVYGYLSPGIERNTLPIGLKEAVDSVKLTNHIIRFQYHIGSKYLDTIDSIQKVVPNLSLYYQLGYKKETWLYNDLDGDSAYYSNYFTGVGDGNRDSQEFRLLTNEFGFSSHKNGMLGLNFDAFMGIERGYYAQNTNVFVNANNLYIGGGLGVRVGNVASAMSSAKLYLNGYNAGDYFFGASGVLNAPKFSIFGKIRSQLYEPSVQQKYFIHPYFGHINFGLKKVLSNSLSVGLRQHAKANPFEIAASITNLNNYVFYNEQARVEQLSTGIQLVNVRLKKNFQYKVLNARLDAGIQQLSAGKIKLPPFSLKLDAFYQNYLADSAVNFKGGFNLRYHSAFKGAGYLPILRQFYYNSGSTVGGYPLLDAYISGDVKTLTVFIKMENILDWYYVQRGVESISTPTYPIQPMAFRLGLLWDFYY